MRGLIVGVCGLVLAACGGSDVVPETMGTTGDNTGSGSTTSPSTSASASSSGPDTSSSTSVEESSGGSTMGGSEATSLETLTDTSSGGSDSTTMVSESESSGSTSVGTGTDDTGMVGLENGAVCMANIECASGFCYLAGILGGICGECLDDDDCFYGCGAANPLAEPPQGSTCDDGSIGAGCQTADACQGDLVCTEIVNVPGVITFSGCSECTVDDDCGTDLCSPNYSETFTEFDGWWECVEAGSVPLGSGCDLAGTGDEACDSGFCATADIMGLLQVGVCSECIVDDDCGAGGTCLPPEVDLMAGISAGTCI